MSNASIITITILVGILIFALWRLFREVPDVQEIFPSQLRKILDDKVRFYRMLSVEEKARYEHCIQRFLRDVTIIPIDCEVDDLDRMLIASSAVITVFGYPGWEFANIDEVILYNTAFDRDYNTTGEGRNIQGMVGEGHLKRAMVLSKPALLSGFENEDSTQNVGIHEFAHLIDKSDGAVDGVPEVFLRHYTKSWLGLIHAEIEKIERGESDINRYGTTNEAEFFSVVTEYFFNQPQIFKERHGELYDTLSKVFNQDFENDKVIK